jgi:hypothetical protein
MSETYLIGIQWCQDNPKFSFWIVVFSGSLFILWLLYLILTNMRLHAYIGSLKKDKDRLMQEKDLIRLGKSVQEPEESVIEKVNENNIKDEQVEEKQTHDNSKAEAEEAVKIQKPGIESV